MYFHFFFPFFLICNKFKYMVISIIISQLIISFILLSNNFYKNHILYKGQKFQIIQQLDFYPIKSLYKTYYENGEFNDINFDTIKTNKFSLIKSNRYSKQCLENYFIESNEACPITDIIFEKNMNDVYQNYIQIDDSEYLYYTNENKLGKLYKSFNYSEFKENKKDIFVFDEILRKEYNKISNPIIDFKYFITFYDIICLTLIIISLFYSFSSFCNKLNCNEFFNFSNMFIQLIILVIYSIRFFKFIEIKKFLLENEDIYERKSYFPNKVFNIDSFPFALSLNIFIFYLLYIIFPKKINCCEFDNYQLKFDEYDLSYIIYLYLLPLFIGNFIVGIFDFLNDKKIKENYNYLTSNWETNPIKSINLSYNEENEYENYSMLYNYSNTSNEIKYETFWKKYFIKFKRMDSYNYFESFKNNKNYYNKKCGKDSYGNDLYFPGEVDCPINEIFFSNFDEDLEDYTKIKLNDTYYLYYTNKSIEGKIIIDLINSSSIYNFPFYEEIDSNFNNQYFYSINYMGINTSSISERSLISKINKLEHNIKLYFILSIVKIVFFCIENIGLFMIGCFVEFKSYIIIIFIFIKMANIIILILCLNIHNIYINNFMNKINIFIEKEKNDIKWNVIILIYSLIFFVVYLFVLFWVICHTECRFHLDSYYDEEPEINIAINNKKELDKNTITSSTDSEKRVKRRNKDNEKKELNKKNEKIKELNEKYNTPKSNDKKK